MIAKKVPMSVALVKTSKRLLTLTVCRFTAAGPGVGAGDGGAGDGGAGDGGAGDGRVQFIPQ